MRAGLLLIWCGSLLMAGSLAPSATAETTPEGVTQLLKRNAIPSIFDPTFVEAQEAKLPDDAWILGVVIDGQARAYSLNLLNHHEIVNDEIAGRPIAAVW
jgi:hypothetical protein